MTTAAQIVPSALAATLGLIGVLFGAKVTSRNQHRQWLRQERLQIYSDYVTLAQETLRLFLMEPQDARRIATSGPRGQVEDKWIEADRLYTKISIIGGQAVRERARNVGRLLADLVEASPVDASVDRESLSTSVRIAIRELQHAAASELGVDT
jgi:hypothetical protein